jgi:pilus assembly protein TadC
MALESLNALSEDKFGKLIEEVISFISGDSDSDKLKETISILCKQDSELSENSIIRAVSSLVLFFRGKLEYSNRSLTTRN